MVNDPAINAFALPGGYVGVHSGLMLATESESELAGVMAHEISHVTQRHISRAVFANQREQHPDDGRHAGRHPAGRGRRRR